MATTHRRRAPLPRTPVPRQPPAPRHHGWRSEFNPYYGYGYRPDWPSILSVAHDTQNGGRIEIITDRPCVLHAPGNVIPLEIYTGLVVLWGEMLLPNKFRFQMNLNVGPGNTWRWGAGTSQLVGAVGARPINPGSGLIDDEPGPFVPPTPATVVQAMGSGYSCTLRMDQPMVTGDLTPDSSILIAGAAPVSVNTSDPWTLSLESSVYLYGGETWEIVGQPGWVVTPVSFPQGGTL